VSGTTFQTIIAWVSVFLGILGILMFISSIFLYFVAAGEEPKMKKGHAVLWGAVACVVIAVVLYFVGIWFAY